MLFHTPVFVHQEAFSWFLDFILELNEQKLLELLELDEVKILELYESFTKY